MGGDRYRRQVEHQIGEHRPGDAAADLGGQIGGGIPPRHPAEQGVDRGHHRVEVGT